MGRGVGREQCSKLWPLPVLPGLLLQVPSVSDLHVHSSRSCRRVNSFSSEITMQHVVSDRNTLGCNVGLGETDTGLSPPTCPREITSTDMGITHPSVTAGQALSPRHPPCPSRNSIQQIGECGKQPLAKHHSFPLFPPKVWQLFKT